MEATLATTQLNVRIPKALKERGDSTLSLVGSTPTRIVRELWTKLAEGSESYEKVHDALTEGISEERQSAIDVRIDAIERSQGLVEAFGASLGIDVSSFEPLSDDEMAEALYDERAKEEDAWL
jgi:hypothetical protein